MSWTRSGTRVPPISTPRELFRKRFVSDGVASETFVSLDMLREVAKLACELQKNVNDCKAFAWLGRYYASKIRGFCELALFDENTDEFDCEASLRHLEEALSP